MSASRVTSVCLSTSSSSKAVTVDEQAFEQADSRKVDEFSVVDETPTFEATVDQEIQAKVDVNHPDGIADTTEERIYGVTLEQEERIQAREAELERISSQAEFGKQKGRAKQTREIAARGSINQRETFQKRAASVGPLADPERVDPRADLTQEQLAAVNEQSIRLAERLDGWTRVAISRRLAEEVIDGRGLTSAVVRVFEKLETGPGQIIPIRKLEDIDRKEVSIDGRVETHGNHRVQALHKSASSRMKADKLA